MANVATAADLYNVRNNLSGDYVQTANIDLSGYANWQPIGDTITPFTGHYNGNGYTINNLNISRSDTDQGLFGNISGGVVLENMNIVDASVSATESVGVLAGSMYDVTSASRIYNIGVSGEATTSGVNAGGLIGFAGWVFGGSAPIYTIEKCYSTVVINAGNGSGGGLLGEITNGSSAGVIRNCYARGSVSGADFLGGLISYIDNTNIENCYSTGAVSSVATCGGLIGTLGGTATVTNAYYDTNTSGRSDNDGRGTPRTTDAMTYPENFTTTFVSWDFSSIWQSDTTYTINDGYPYFITSWNIWVKKLGLWEPVIGVWVKKGGTWQSISGIWAKKGGTWNTI